MYADLYWTDPLRFWLRTFLAWCPQVRITEEKRTSAQTYTVGDRASVERRVTELDVLIFALLTGDKNPVHLDASYARETRFKGVIAHGLFTLTLVGTVFGFVFPGPGAIYLEQSVRFKEPVRPGDVLVASVEVAELLPHNRARFVTTVRVQDKVVLEGEAVLLLP